MRALVKALSDIAALVVDVRAYWWVYPRRIAACRGVHASWQDAAAARSNHKSSRIMKRLVYPALPMGQVESLRNRDYPIIVHLLPVLEEGTKVFNLGGSIGREYLSYRKMIRFPSDIAWRICEVPEVVTMGNEMLQSHDCPGLSFTSDVDGSANIFLSCGALQYMEEDLPGLLAKFTRLPKHILLNRVPMQDAVETFFTVQNIGSDAVSYRIENQSNFIRSLSTLGYRMVDGWRDDRKLKIPFYRKGTVNGYFGFYFALDEVDPG